MTKKVPLFGFHIDILLYKPYASDITIDDKHGSFCINHQTTISEIWPNHMYAIRYFQTKLLIIFKSWMQNPGLQKVCPLLHNRRYSLLLTFSYEDKHKRFQRGFCNSKICTSNLIQTELHSLHKWKNLTKYESFKQRLSKLPEINRNAMLPLCLWRVLCFDISQPGPSPPLSIPATLTLLTFLPPSCLFPIPHPCSFCSSPGLLLFLYCKSVAHSYSAVLLFETRKTPTLRSKRRGVGLNSGVQGDLHHLFKILKKATLKKKKKHWKATIWLMFSKHKG